MHLYVFGIFTGLVLSGILYLIASGSGLIQWVYQHEALAAALLATASAGMTVYFLHRQIRLTSNIEEGRRLAKLDAERAMLSHALDRLSDYAWDFLEQGLKMARGEAFEPVNPSINEKHLATIKACIEFASGNNKRNLIAVLSEIQVLRARLVDEIEKYHPIEKMSPGTADTRAVNELTSIENAIILLLTFQELWTFARPHKNLVNPIDTIPRSQRITAFFTSRRFERFGPEPEQLWPNLIKSLQKAVDKTA